MISRLKKAWRVLKGEDLGPLAAFWPRNRIVQLMTYHDRIFGLTDSGGIVELNLDYSGQFFSLMELVHP